MEWSCGTSSHTYWAWSTSGVCTIHPLTQLTPSHPHRLTLLYDTVLFLSREALRKAGLSCTSSHTHWGHTSNLMWCWSVELSLLDYHLPSSLPLPSHTSQHLPSPPSSIPAGIILSCVLGALWLSPAIIQPNVPHDTLSVAVFCGCALVELAVEPAWVFAQMYHYVTLKVCVIVLVC